MTYKVKDKQPRRVGFNCDEDEAVIDPSLLNSINVTVDEKPYVSVAVQSIGPNGKVEVSAKEYLKVKTFLIDLIKRLGINSSSITEDLCNWYKQEMEWENVWKINDIIHKLTKEEYELLEDHIREQIDYEEDED